MHNCGIHVCKQMCETYTFGKDKKEQGCLLTLEATPKATFGCTITKGNSYGYGMAFLVLNSQEKLKTCKIQCTKEDLQSIFFFFLKSSFQLYNAHFTGIKTSRGQRKPFPPSLHSLSTFSENLHTRNSESSKPTPYLPYLNIHTSFANVINQRTHPQSSNPCAQGYWGY